MNKKLLSVLAAFGILISCSYQQEAYTPHPEAEAVKEQLKDRRLGQETEKQPGIKKASKPAPGPVVGLLFRLGCGSACRCRLAKYVSGRRRAKSKSR